MPVQDLKERTKKFAVKIILLSDTFPKTQAGKVVGNQILRSGTSIGANYRSANRGRSKAEFISKVTIAEEEADETVFWFEVIKETKLITNPIIDELLAEAKELTAILTTIAKNAKNSK